jgi:hypothetical protein
MKNLLSASFFISCSLILSCAASRNSFDPDRKYPPAELRKDYALARKILEEWHPSLYWYISRDSLNYYFDRGYGELNDSMTEPQFRTLLSYVFSRIGCGHTSVRSSRSYSRYLDTARRPLFPLIFKCWQDTMVVAANLDRKDSILKRGFVITSINGRAVSRLRDTLFDYFAADGYNLTGKYQYLSSGLNFGAWYKNVFGYTDSFTIGYIDTDRVIKETRVPVYDPKADTVRTPFRRLFVAGAGGRGQAPGKERAPGKRQRKIRESLLTRSLQIDSSANTATMTLNTFEHGYHLGSFIRRSFRTLRERRIPNLIIDVRSNGGGDASNSTLLTRYIIDKKFKIADSLYAVRRSSPYDRYIDKGFLYSFLTALVSSKRSDGKYHFRYFEKHYYYPKKSYHFDGQVYILTGGNSFSATCLFAGAVKGQKNITLVGEETGGGYYGNTAWMIPDVTLPVTGVRFRLPRFRLVVDRLREKNGRGVEPDVIALPTVDAVMKGFDFKTAKAKELIQLHAAQK